MEDKHKLKINNSSYNTEQNVYLNSTNTSNMVDSNTININTASDKESNILYIKREKKSEIKQKILNSITSISLYSLTKLYQGDDLVFRICYDRVYRPSLFSLITNTSISNINVSRNLFSMNEEQYSFTRTDSNKTFNEDEVELNNENNYITSLVRYKHLDLMSTVSYPVVIGLITFIKFRASSSSSTNYGLNKMLVRMFLSFVFFNLAFSVFLETRKTKIKKGVLFANLRRKYEVEFDKYKEFYYDEE